MEKREEIIQTAIYFFGEKGYFSTSMQDIAKECGISKGTLYNFFESKEDLLVQVIDSGYQKMMENIRIVDYDSSLTPKERLVKKIEMQFEVIVPNKNFIVMTLKSFIPSSNPQVSWLMDKVYAVMTVWYKESILEAFGSQAEPYIWDFTLMLQGMVKEYTFLAVQDHKELDYSKASRFIVDRLDIMIQHTKGVQPVLTSHDMAEYEAFEKDVKRSSPDEQIRCCLDDLERELSKAPLADSKMGAAVEAVRFLRSELELESPRRFMMDSILLYLDEVEAAGLFVKRLRLLINEVYVQ